RDWPRELRWQLGTVLERFDQLVAIDRVARDRANPRRYLAVNSRSNVFEPFFTSRLVTTTTPHNTRTQHGFGADRSPADAHDRVPPRVRGSCAATSVTGLPTRVSTASSARRSTSHSVPTRTGTSSTAGPSPRTTERGPTATSPRSASTLEAR